MLDNVSFEFNNTKIFGFISSFEILSETEFPVAVYARGPGDSL